MTYKQAFENSLIELNKVQAPPLLLEDFVYLFNKAIQKYINKRYNTFEISQQLTDDLRVLLKTEKLNVIDSSAHPSTFDGSWTVNLPPDYVHMLNCVCEFKSVDTTKCGDSSVFQVGANKMDTSEWPHVINNYYMKPSIKRPYYYISNIIDPEVTNRIILNGVPSDQYTINEEKIRGERYGNSVTPVM